VGIAKRLRILPVLLAAALAGCGDDNSIGGVSANCGLAGTSTGSFSGAVSGSLTGCAVFTVSTGTVPSTGIVISAGTAASPTHVLTLAREGGRPATGVYAIGAGAGQFSGVFTFDGGSSADRTFALTGGSVNVTNSPGSSLTATLTSVTAVETNAGAAALSLTGNFTAKCIVTGSTTC
jgi:hypothetical protein